MKGSQRIPSDGLWLAFEPEAEQEIEHYLRAHSIDGLSYSSKRKIIKKVYDFTVKLADYHHNLVTTSSLNTIQRRFSKDVELEPVYKKVLSLLLVVLEREKGIRAPELGTNCYIGQEVPQLTPDTFFNSRLSAQIYALIESKPALQDYLECPQDHIGYLVLWLCLKEGIDQQKAINVILSTSDVLLQIDNHWFFPYDKKRYWLSTQAELLLHRWYETKGSRKLRVINAASQYLNAKGLLPWQTPLSFIELRQMLKLEFVMTRSAIEYGLSSRKVDSAVLPEHALFRILKDVRIEPQQTTSSQLVTTVRQSRSWGRAFADSHSASQYNVRAIEILELTTKQQLSVVSGYTKRLIKAIQKISTSIRYQLLEDLRPKIEAPESAKKMPWAWLLLSWLYHLLRYGGKHKSTLRLDTIKTYVNYVAEPFIAEFNGCDPSAMNELDWAEKLNMVVERIASVGKKACVAYFAEFLIDSELVPNLCLSDIDVPAVQHNTDANLISQHEADRIIDALEHSAHPKAELAKLCFIFGFYLGLRRNEIKGLQFKDFHYYQHKFHTLHVRPNKYRLLKSTASSRNLPLDALVPERILGQILAYLDKSKVKFISKETSIYHFYSDGELNEGFSFLTNVIKGITGDETLRFHHCRHSFCNWNIMLFYGDMLDNPRAYPFLNHPYFDQKRSDFLKERLGLGSLSRKGFWSVGEMLGHAAPSTTASSYFHMADFLRRALFANHKAELWALRLVWGQRISTDVFGRITSKPSIAEKLSTTKPRESKVLVAQQPFDIKVHYKQVATKSLDGLGLDMYWRILSRTAEGHSPINIANDLNVDIGAVNSVLELEEMVTARVSRHSKHKARPRLNYARLNAPNVSILKGLIKRFMMLESQLEQELNLSLISSCIENVIGAKDALIRTYNKNSALTLLRFMKIMDFEPFEIKVKWYMANVMLTEQEQLKPYLHHLDFWLKALSAKVELPPSTLSIVLPTNLNAFRRQFEQRAPTTVSDEGKFLAYHAPGYVSIHAKQKRFYSDKDKSRESLPSRPRRTRAFVSFLRLLVVYVSARETK